jgi:hypothetical protein
MIILVHVHQATAKISACVAHVLVLPIRKLVAYVDLVILTTDTQHSSPF